MCGLPNSGKTFTSCLMKSTPSLRLKFKEPIVLILPHHKLSKAKRILSKLDTSWAIQPALEGILNTSSMPHYILINSSSHQAYISSIVRSIHTHTILVIDSSIQLEVSIYLSTFKHTMMYIGYRYSTIYDSIIDDAGILSMIPSLYVCRDSDRYKSIVSILSGTNRSYRDSMNDESMERESDGTEKNRRGVIRLVTDSRKEKEKITDVCMENGVSVNNDQIVSNNNNNSEQHMSGEISVDIIQSVCVNMDVDDEEIMRVILNTPRNFEDIVANISFNSNSNLKQVMMVNHKDYITKRINILSEFIDNAGLQKWLSGIKRSYGKENFVRYNSSDMFNLLGTNKKQSFNWLFKELHIRRICNVIGCLPVIVNIEILPQNVSKVTDALLCDIMNDNTPVAGKYRICLMSLCSLSSDIVKRQMELKSSKNSTEFEELLSKVSELYSELVTRRNKRLINIEVIEETYFMEILGLFTDSDILKIISLRNEVEIDQVEQVEGYY